jgi:protein-L-isoaspartate(D-aspartate) O-methyltransferase
VRLLGIMALTAMTGLSTILGLNSQGDPTAAARQRLVDSLRSSGIRNEAVLGAMRRVPRHLFVPPDIRHLAYDDTPLAIGFGQTISQPFIVAYMTDVLQVSKEQEVLEIGTGSGYQAAILAELVRQVYTIELLPELAQRARETLTAYGYRNVEVRTGNGYLGWPEHAPFSRIIVTAAPEIVPQTLIDQLGVGGIMVVPVGAVSQAMTIVTKTAAGVTEQRTLPVRFVPMVK